MTPEMVLIAEISLLSLLGLVVGFSLVFIAEWLSSKERS